MTTIAPADRIQPPPIPVFNPDLSEHHTLPRLRNWREERHVFTAETRAAVQAALACRRPLLLLGEPGLGKTQLARAAAKVLGWPLIYQVVNGRTECEDLLYRFDAVARLARAQVLSHGAPHVPCAGPELLSRAELELAPLNYVQPGVLWWAYDWEKARRQVDHSQKYCGGGENWAVANLPEGWQKPGPNKGVVVLIDEIDKADAEVPNSLLEGLGTVGFQVPHGGDHVNLPEGHVPPLVVITSNEERELPPAFVRRCVVLRLKLPTLDEAEKLRAALLGFAAVHFEETQVNSEVRAMVYDQWLKDRAQAVEGDPRAGLAEFLDMLRALAEMYPGDHDKQKDLLARTQAYILGKHGQSGTK